MNGPGVCPIFFGNAPHRSQSSCPFRSPDGAFTWDAFVLGLELIFGDLQKNPQIGFYKIETNPWVCIKHNISSVMCYHTIY